jgi:hypothetical protein
VFEEAATLTELSMVEQRYLAVRVRRKCDGSISCSDVKHRGRNGEISEVDEFPSENMKERR